MSICNLCQWQDLTHDEQGAIEYCQRRLNVYSDKMETMKKCLYYVIRRDKDATT